VMDDVGDVLMAYPALSKPRTQTSFLIGRPFFILVPMYSVLVKAYNVGSKDPNSKGLNS
jgi:hypothetical protein